MKRQRDGRTLGWISWVAILFGLSAVTSCGELTPEHDSALRKLEAENADAIGETNGADEDPDVEEDDATADAKCEPQASQADALETKKIGIDTMLDVAGQFSQMTGVEMDDDLVASLFEQLKQSNEANPDKPALAPAKSAISQLAGNFCNMLLGDRDLAAVKLPGIDLDSPVSSALSGGLGSTLINTLISSFWGGGLLLTEEQAKSKQLMNTLLQGLIGSNMSGGADSTKNIAAGLCTTVLSVAPALIL